jgi:SAM-dependent methyltransferase
MEHYYTASTTYYENIDFTERAWVEDKTYIDIVKRLESCQAIVEVGCGSANILRHHPHLERHYAGCDFSESLMTNNRTRFPSARFVTITDSPRLPFPDGCADAIFSVYVIEHTVYPSIFLDECHRLLRPGGLFILRCPDFMGPGKLTSQRAGFTEGNGREKLRRGRWLDAALTGWDRKVAIPARCASLRRQLGRRPGFWVNLAPTCLTDRFQPDVDAVYLTYDREIIHHLRDRIKFDESTNADPENRIYLVGHRCL